MVSDFALDKNLYYNQCFKTQRYKANTENGIRMLYLQKKGNILKHYLDIDETVNKNNVVTNVHFSYFMMKKNTI